MPRYSSFGKFINSENLQGTGNSLPGIVSDIHGFATRGSYSYVDRELTGLLGLPVRDSPRKLCLPVRLLIQTRFSSSAVLTRFFKHFSVVMNIASIVLIAMDPSFINGSYILLSNNVNISFCTLSDITEWFYLVRCHHRCGLCHHLDTASKLEQTWLPGSRSIQRRRFRRQFPSWTFPHYAIVYAFCGRQCQARK